MNHIKPYKLFENESEFNLDLVMSKIREKFPEDTIIDLYDNEILEWVDEDWSDEYDSEYDWYVDHGRGEAQDVIINDIITWAKNECGLRLDTDQHCELFDGIKQEYDCLNYI